MTHGKQSKIPRVLLIPILVLTLAADAAFGFVCERTGGGQCVHWVEDAATLQSFLGSPGAPLSNGTVTWDQNAISAANDWNAVGANFHFSIGVGGQFHDPCGAQGMNNVCAAPPGVNPIYFADSQCGVGFGDAIELTLLCWVDANGAIQNAAVLVNNNVRWNAYDGDLRFSNSQVVYDVRRVLLHEFGHVLGLDHPDQQGQTVSAIMNSRVSNLFQLQPDDRSGIFSLYPSAAPPPSDGGSSPSTGCQIERRPTTPMWWLLALPLGVAVLMGRRRLGDNRLGDDRQQT